MKYLPLFATIAMSLTFSCSKKGANPAQFNPDESMTLSDQVASKAKTGKHSPVMAMGVFSSFGFDQEGHMECIMKTRQTDKRPASFKISHKSKKMGNVTVTSRKQRGGTANMTVYYFGFTAEARAAFQSAVDIWADNLNSGVDITVLAQFAPLSPGVLGSAGSTLIVRDFPGAQKNTWYGNALADKLAGQDLFPEYFDIVANFSSAYPNWYFETDGNPPAGDFDFRTVVLHELGHGLNFFGGMTYYAGMGSYGFGLDPVFPTIYDQFVVTRPGRQLTKTNKFPNPSGVLGEALIGEQILFSGPKTISETQGARALLFTPDNWRPGSSYSHLDEYRYSGTDNGLMTPFLAPGEAYSHPGPIAKGMLNDLGWNNNVPTAFLK